MEAIKFGTDGWRGLIGADFTFERLLMVAPIAAAVLADTYGSKTGNRLIIVGFDRRFMAATFAHRMAVGLQQVGFDVLLGDTFAPTPAFSWAAHSLNALGALVITASHNPGTYLGSNVVKVPGVVGAKVSPNRASICFVTSGETEPPKFPFTFKPKYVPGLWLAVITKAPSAFRLCAAQLNAGVGAKVSLNSTSNPTCCSPTAIRCAKVAAINRRYLW